MYIYVRDVMDLPVMKDAFYLAGKNGENRIVKSTTALDTPDGVQFLKGDEFVLSTMYAFSQDDKIIKETILALIDKNIAGLGIYLGKYLEELPKEVVNIADEHGLPIISLPTEKSWSEIISPIMSEVFKADNKYSVLKTEIKGQFTNLMFSGSGTQELAELLYFYISSPIGIYDFLEENMFAIPNNNLPKSNFVQKQIKSTNKNKLGADSELSSIVYRNESYYLLTIKNNSFLYGAIIFKKKNKQLTKTTLSALMHAKNLLKFKIDKKRNEINKKMNVKEDILHRLIQQTVTRSNIDEIRKEARKSNIKFYNNYKLILYRLREREIKDIEQLKFKIELISKCEVINAFFEEKYFLIAVPMIEKDSNKCTTNKVNKLLADNLSGHSGVSNYITVFEMFKGFEQAKVSLNFATENDKKSVSYDELGIYSLLLHSKIKNELEPYVKKILSPLINYEKNNHLDLLNTLKIFLECRGNYRTTGEKLHLHYNSVRYRIKLIESLTTFEMEDPDSVLEFQLALKLYYFLNK